MSANSDLIAERLKVLWSILHGQIDIIIVQVSTLQTRLCPPEYLHAHVMLLQVGSKLNITKIRKELVNVGYSIVEQVLEAGEFAIRGGVIDILPMGAKKIVRIDLFDDEIETIALLDPKTRLLVSKIDRFELVPAHEFPTDIQTLQIVANKIMQLFPNAHDLSKDIVNNILPSGVAFYLPLFFEQTVTLFDYLDNNTVVAYTTETLAQLNFNWQDIGKRYELFSYQAPCLKPSVLFVPSDEILHKINQINSYLLQTSGELYVGINTLIDVQINHKANNPFANLTRFMQHFKGTILICTESLGRAEILSQTLNSHSINIKLINTINDIENVKEQIYLIVSPVYQGFITNDLALITEDDLYRNTDGLRIIRRKNNSPSVESDMLVRDLAEIKIGDYVVHINHGIGRYLGLTTREIADNIYELIELEYQNGSKLLIPVTNLHMINRYSKLENVVTELSTLGSKKWANAKAKAETRVNDLAVELLELYAKREMQEGDKYSIPSEYELFVHHFGYEPTPDQQRSFNEIITDMTQSKPMDRLVCGDVGFGKTEVAMRAAFISAMNGKQVAVLTPTTLLAEQHYQNFVNRFASMPLKIAEISRFKSKKEIVDSLELVKEGKIDILIGTHRLIQDDVKFANLGLVIIDEEHRFGVKQKEKLKQLRANVNFLALTATPIPRSLSMALDGLRDFSIIATPPSRRLSVNTIICNDDNSLIKEAISREIRRGGQVFFLYNDVASINLMYDKLIQLMPELRVAIAHGQMNGSVLEQTIRDFIRQKYNVLLCSTIIETGIDIQNANTILIYRADKFGLAQLHQLRGRVGRSHHQAYCYLIIPENVTRDAEKRLEAIEMTKELGSGFNLALHDLEIRGAGEILGDNQSGEIKHVGLSLYTEMLKRTISRLKRGESLDNIDKEMNNCEVNLNATSILPANYCIDIHERLIFYKRLARSDTSFAVDTVYQDIIDRYGLPPQEVKTLINSHYIRVRATQIGVQKIDVNATNITLKFVDKPPIEPLKIVLLLQKLKTCKYDGLSKLIWQVKCDTIMEKIKQVNYILTELV